MAEWGIDISNHQAGADLSKAKAAGCAFVFAKATEGLTYRDDHFAGFRQQAKAIGLPFGAYHFARPQAGRTGDQEARTFLTVAGKPDGLPHVLDLEDTKLSPQATTGWALDWLTTVHKATGVRPIIYTYSAFAAAHLFPSTALASYPLWLANYRTTPPPAPKPWASWLVWQHTSSATVPGIPGRCDRNQASPAFLPTTAPQEDFMSELSDQEQRDLYNRVMGGIPAGDVRGAKNPDGSPAWVLTSADGNTIVNRIAAAKVDVDALAAATAAKVSANASAADIAAELLKQITAPKES